MMNYLKFCFLIFNPVTIAILLFVPLSSASFGSEESIIPESNISGGDSSGGENFGESIIPESDITNGDNSGGGNLDEDGESIIPESDITNGDNSGGGNLDEDGESIIPESDITNGDNSGGGNLDEDGESIIPESDITNGDNSGGGNLDEDGESIIPESDVTQGIIINDDGTITATPEIIARLDSVAVSIINDLNSGAIRIVNSYGKVVTVHIDTQKIIANILEQDSNALSLKTEIENVSFNNDSSPITVNTIQIIESVFETLGEDTIFISDNEFDVTITYIDTNGSLNLKSNKIARSKDEPQTYQVKVVNRSTKKTAMHTLRGSKDQVESAASAITALTLAQADFKTIRVAKEIALDSAIKPELLVELMLNYEGLFDNSSSHNANSSSSLPTIASNKQLSSFDLAKQDKSIVDIAKLSRSIQAYNQAIQKSEPDIQQQLTKNDEFQVIGQTLQRLRKSL